MKVSALGEFGLIDLLAKMAYDARDSRQASWQQLVSGIGDDAAAWRGDTSIQLATTDSFIQDIHFTLDAATWEDVGWKAMAVNLSDIAAMGGLPRYALVSLALPSHTEVDEVTALYRGMIELARQFEVAIVGGNISGAPLVAINITVLGSSGGRGKQILTRSSARPGDKIAVTGTLGAAAAGIRMLKEKLQFSSEVTASFKNAFLRPHPRIAEGQLLTAGEVKAAIDISDGLVHDLGHICQASRVGARLEIDRMPIQDEVKANLSDSALELALSGGEDYELLFTGSAEVIDRIKESATCPITIVGDIVADKMSQITLVDNRRKAFKLAKTGWEHFAPK